MLNRNNLILKLFTEVFTYITATGYEKIFSRQKLSLSYCILFPVAVVVSEEINKVLLSEHTSYEDTYVYL